MTERVVAAGAAVAAHATALAGGNVWLDHAHLEQGLALAPPGQWLELFARGFAGTGFYRPLAALSFSIDAAVSRAPLLFHVTTLLWHAAAAALTVQAARVLGCSRRAALIAGVLFAVHPVTSLVAAANAFRSESMALVFLLALLCAHERGRPLLAAASLLLGALTKETAWVLAPLFVLLLEWQRRAGAPRVRLLVAEGAAFVAASALRIACAPAFRAHHVDLTFDEALGTRLAAFAKSALRLLAPLEDSICDAFPVTSLLSLPALFGLAVLLGVAWLIRRSGRVGGLFAFSLLPSLQLIPIMRWWSPHYLYVSLAFGAILVGEVLAQRAARTPRLVWGAALALGALCLFQDRRFASDAVLWAPEVAREPACREGHFYLGETAREAGDLDAAAKHYAQAVGPFPGYLAYADEQATRVNLGAVRFAQTRFSEARALWTSALERSTDAHEQRELAHNLGALALRSGDTAEAVKILEQETRRSDAIPASLLLRAKALHVLGRDEEARQHLARAGMPLARMR